MRQILITLIAISTPAFAQCDLNVPVLDDFDFSPVSVDVTGGDQTVVLTFDLSDDISGIERVGVTLRGPSLEQNVDCTATTPVAGTPVDGTYTCTITIPQNSEAGLWLVDQIGYSDKVNRSDASFTDDLVLRGLPTQLLVTSNEDVDPPILTNLTVAPGSIDVSSGLQFVTCTMTATDNLTGVAGAQCSMVSSVEEQNRSCFALAPSSGTTTNGTFQCDIPVPQYAEDGTWDLFANLGDVVGNRATYETADLTGAGFDDSVDVTSTPEDMEAPVLLDFDLDPLTVNTEDADRIVTCSARLTDNLAGAATFGCSATFIDPSFQFVTQSCAAIAPDSGDAGDGNWSCDLPLPRYSPGGNWGFVTAIYADFIGNPGFSDPAALQLGGYPSAFDVVCDTGGGPGPGPVATWSDAFVLEWTAQADATQYTVYGGPLTLLTDADQNGLPDVGYGSCRNSEDANTADTFFVDATMPAPGEGIFILVGHDTITEQDQGLGQTSGVQDRFVFVSCP